MKQPKEIVVYRTERMTVVRLAFRDFVLYVDGELISFHDTQAKAEHNGAVILHEEAETIALRMARAA